MQTPTFRAAIAAIALVAVSGSAVLARPVDAPITEADLAAHMRMLAQSEGIDL